MNSVEKDNLIQKAICCSGTKGKEVADMFLNGHKCAKEEFEKLFLLISYIETLGCYQAPLEETTNEVVTTDSTSAEFTFTIPCSIWEQVVAIGQSATITINGNITSFSGDDSTQFGVAITTLLNTAEFAIEETGCLDPMGNNEITVIGLCNTESLVITLNLVDTATIYTGINTVTGVCGTTTIETNTEITEYTNCLTEDQADSLANNIALLCNLCDEH